MGRRYSREQWLEWIEEQESSGLSIAAFCERVGVSQNAFYWRRRQLAWERASVGEQTNTAAAASVAVAAKTAGGFAGSSGPFVALQLKSNGGPAVVEVDLPCGATLRVLERSTVGDVVSALLNTEVAK